MLYKKNLVWISGCLSKDFEENEASIFNEALTLQPGTLVFKNVTSIKTMRERLNYICSVMVQKLKCVKRKYKTRLR